MEEIFKMAEIVFKARKIRVSLESNVVKRYPMGTDCSSSAWQRGDPGRSGDDNRLFAEAVLWACTHWRAVAPSAQELRQVVSVWNASGDWRSKACSSEFSQRCRKIPISNMRSSTPRSSRFTDAAPTQKGTQAIGKV
jgi:hypothetical protein